MVFPMAFILTHTNALAEQGFRKTSNFPVHKNETADSAADAAP
jgi:hypothetical protein